mmetsp:Transcript_66055/g.175904  ORF Transcript_66055/g.175904 Transcript_66055/m.175904 type:complete len:233 (-) Transcript_66055:1534-2232(-)
MSGHSFSRSTIRTRSMTGILSTHSSVDPHHLQYQSTTAFISPGVLRRRRRPYGGGHGRCLATTSHYTQCHAKTDVIASMACPRFGLRYRCHLAHLFLRFTATRASRCARPRSWRLAKYASSHQAPAICFVSLWIGPSTQIGWKCDGSPLLQGTRMYHPLSRSELSGFPNPAKAQRAAPQQLFPGNGSRHRRTLPCRRCTARHDCTLSSLSRLVTSTTNSGALPQRHVNPRQK